MEGTYEYSLHGDISMTCHVILVISNLLYRQILDSEVVHMYLFENVVDILLTYYGGVIWAAKRLIWPSHLFQNLS